MRYVIYSNVPGYMPESEEPMVADTIDAARACLALAIEQDWDDEQENHAHEPDCPVCLSIDGRYLDAHTQVNLVSVPGSVHVPGPEHEIHALGRTYSIDVLED